MPSALDAYDPIPLDAAKAAGYVGGIGYVCADPAKRVSPAQLAAAAAAGVAYALVYEDGAADFFGAKAGVTKAVAARPILHELAWPAGRPVYAAVDWPAPETDWPQIWLAVAAFADTLGRPAAVYGPRPFLAWAETVHGCRYLWEAAGWKTGPAAEHTCLAQQPDPVDVGGVSADVDIILADDWGQHPYHPAAPPGIHPQPGPPKEDDMIATATVDTDLHIVQIGPEGGLRHWTFPPEGPTRFELVDGGGLDPAVTPVAGVFNGALHVTAARPGGDTPVVYRLDPAGTWSHQNLPS